MSTWNLGQNDPPEELLLLRNQMASKESQIASYQTQLMRKADELDELKKSFEDTIHKLSYESKRAQDFERNLRQRDAELSNEKLTRQNMETALKTANASTKDADFELRNLQSILDALSQESRTHQERSRQLEKEKASLSERVKELQVHIEQSASETDKRNANRPRSSSLSNFRVSALEETLRETQASLNKRDEKLRAATTKLTAAQAESLRAGNEKLALERSLSRRLQALEATLEEKEQEIQCLKGEQGNGDREQELMARIDEDEAKIAALEAMVRSGEKATLTKQKFVEVERQLDDERKKSQRANTLASQLEKEKQTILGELRVAQADLARHRVEGTRSDNARPPSTEDTDTAEYVHKLLAAVERLRGERDDLERDVQFLESESRFAIEALEAKLLAASASSDASVRSAETLDQMKSQMGTLHAELVETKKQAQAHIHAKLQQILRLQRTVVGLALTVNNSSQGDESRALQLRLSEVETKLEVTIRCLEATTGQRDDLANSLRDKEMSWSKDMETMRFDQQQAVHTIQDLRNEISDVNSQLEQVEAQRKSLIVQIENVEGDLQAARNNLTEAETRYSNLQSQQLDAMSSSEATASLRTKIRELEARVLRRNEQVGIHQHDIRRLETNLRLQEDRLNEMTSEMETLNAQKAAMVEDCENTRAQRDVALAKLERLEEEIANLEASHAQDEGAIRALIHVIIDTASNAKDAIREQQESSRTSLQHAIVLAEGLKSEKSRVEAEVESHQQRISQLETQLSALNDVHAEDLARDAAMEQAMKEQAERMQGEIEQLREAKAVALGDHADETKKLHAEIDQLRHRIKEIETSSLDQNQQIALVQQMKERDVQALEQRVVDLQATLAKAEADHKLELTNLEKQLTDLSTLKDSLQSEMEEHVRTAGQQLEAETARLKALADSDAAQLKETLLVVSRLEQERSEMSDKLATAGENLKTSQSVLQDLTHAHEAQLTEATRLASQIDLISGECRTEKQARENDHREYEIALAASCDDAQQTQAQLDAAEQELVEIRNQLKEVEQANASAIEEKDRLQEQIPTLLAQIEQSRSVQRVLEDQIADREQSIATLKADVSRVQTDLARVEQTGAKANLDLSMISAQHKREMASLQKELQVLRSKSNLEEVIAELEERNQEMDVLLKQKCEEIEANDDRALEMLKENKKLQSKVDSSARKVAALQAKLEKLRSQSKQAESKSLSPTAPTAPTASGSKPSPRTAFQPPNIVSATASAPSLAGPSSMSDSSSNDISRTTSLQRSKAPDMMSSPAPAPQIFHGANAVRQSPILAPSPDSIIGKKRRAPDDFEDCNSLPPQVFTADSVPGDDSDGRTPRVRRMLSSLQSGFTPIRNVARPTANPSSAKRNPVPSHPPQHIAEITNSPLVVPPLNPGLQSAKSKRSWLGKIRGASTSTTTSSSSSQGMSRMQ